MDWDSMRTAFTDTIPWIKMSGLKVDIFEERHVKLSVPVQGLHLNHVGLVYAGTSFMLMEVAGAALFVSAYGVERFIPVNKGMTIRYVKPATSDIACELNIGIEEAQAKLKPIEERGKGEWVLEMAVTDTSGTVVATSICTYYIIPLPSR
jgi:acyl-coenzyme A thioesterase PaaI-like protein